MAELLRVNNLKTYFDRYDGVVKAVDGISYKVNYGETLAIVGESGSGKTVSVLSLLRLIKRNGRIVDGEAIFDGKDLLKLNKEELRQVRGKDISIVFQDPMTSLNPIMRVGIQIMEPILWHKVMSDKEARDRAIELLRLVGIPEYKTRVWDYPFQFSGGMRQRVMIAIALACNPKLVIADEPTTALDVTIQAQIIELIKQLQKELGMSLILITHDMGIVAETCKNVLVMYAGKVVEFADVRTIFKKPSHPYTIGLLESVPRLDVRKERLKAIEGQPPDLVALPSYCYYAERCPYKTDRCLEEIPDLIEVEPGHYSRCFYAKGIGVKV